MIVLAKRTCVLSLLLLISVAAVGSAAEYTAVVETLDVNETDDAVEFTITSTEWVRFTYFELDGPRVVVDFHNSENQIGYQTTSIGKAGVRSVRVASFSSDSRDATRFVFDLEGETPFEIVDDGEGGVRIRFGEEADTPSDLEALAEVAEAPVFDTEPDDTLAIEGSFVTEEADESGLEILEAAVVDPVTVVEETAEESVESVSVEETAAVQDATTGVEDAVEGGTAVVSESLKEVSEPEPSEFEEYLLPLVQFEPVAEAVEFDSAEPVVDDVAAPVVEDVTAAEDESATAPLVEDVIVVEDVTLVASVAPTALPPAVQFREPAVAANEFAEIAAAEFAVIVPTELAEIAPNTVSVLAEPLPSVQVQAPLAAAPPPAPSAFLEQEELEESEPQYTGEIVSFNLVGSDIVDFFRVIAELSGLNIILDDQVTGQLNLVLNNVPWDQALDLVLRTNGLGYELQGNILRIAPQNVLTAEEDARRALRDAQALNVPLETRPFILSYTIAADVSAAIMNSSLLSSRGTILQDIRRNALVITDVPAQFAQIESLIGFLDTPAQQVEIEARLLSATKSFSREIGSQLGLVVGNNSQNNFSGLPTTGSPVIRTPTPAVNVGGALPLVADFPSAAGSGFAFLLGAGGDVLLDEIINLAEANGTAKLLSRPRITTQNNVQATVAQGTQIPVQTNVNNTISVTFIPFNLSLSVTPQITEAGTILLRALIENSSPDFGRAVGGVPSVSTQQAETEVLIPDGGTAVIGGILIDNDSVNISQIPGLGSIPVLGNLFKSTSTVKSTSELLFFITARIKPTDPLDFLTGNLEDESELFEGTFEEPSLQ